MNKLLDFLDKLEDNGIYYILNKRQDGILIEIVVAYERWEVVFERDGSVDIEKFFSSDFISDGRYNEPELEALFSTILSI